jgi:hypothetical protein
MADMWPLFYDEKSGANGEWPTAKKEGKQLQRTATTSYPCCISALGEFRGSKSCSARQRQRYKNYRSVRMPGSESLRIFFSFAISGSIFNLLPYFPKTSIIFALQFLCG